MNFQDLSFMTRVILGASVTLVFIWWILNAMATANQQFGGTGMDQQVLEGARDGFAIGDYMIPFVLFILGITSVILSTQVDSHPIYFIYVIILIMISTFFSVVVANVVITLFDSAPLSEAASNFQLTKMMWENWPFIISALILLDAVSMLSKFR